MMAMRQAVDVHVSNPFMSHHAGGVPTIDHTVIAVPNEHRSKGKSIPCDPVTATVKCRNRGLASLKLPFLQMYLLLLHVESFSRTPLPLFINPSRCEYGTSVRKE